MFDLTTTTAHDKTRVREVRLVAPAWDEEQTTAFLGRMSRIRALIYALTDAGLTDDEIAQDITHQYPADYSYRVTTRGSRVIVEIY